MGYEEKRFVPRKSPVEKTRRDTEAAARLLAANVVSVSDGGGEFFAAKVPVVGRAKVALLLSNLFKATAGFTSKSRVVELNGLFGVVTEREDAPPGYAGKLVTLFQLDGEGLIERVYFVMASRELKALPAVGVAEAEAGR